MNQTNLQTPVSTKPRRIPWLDVAKGIAMLCVMLGHYGKDNINYIVFGFHLPVFLLLSGYTMKKRTLDSGFAHNYFKKLMVPYFGTCLCVLLMDIFNAMHFQRIYTVQGLTDIIAKDLLRSFFASGASKTFGNIDLGTRIGAVWFLPALFFATMLAQWAWNRFESRKKQYVVVLAAALIAFISARFIWLPFSIQAGFFSAPFLLIGRDLRESGILQRIGWKQSVFLLLVSVFGVHKKYSSIGLAGASSNDLILSLVVGLCMSLLVIRLSMLLSAGADSKRLWLRIPLWLPERALRFVGKNSLLYLCVHLFELETLYYVYNRLYAHIGLTRNDPVWMRFPLQLAMVSLIVGLLLLWKWLYAHRKTLASASGARDNTIDCVKGVLILTMLVGHAVIDRDLRNIIYSFHMAAFILLSGYFYRSGRPLGQTIGRLCRAFLLPYAVYCILHLLLKAEVSSAAELTEQLKVYGLAISFTKELLPGTRNVGPVYFIPLLFMVRLLFTLLEHGTQRLAKRKNLPVEGLLVVGVGVLSMAGLLLGEKGYWLPWSLDVALYGVAFYYIGYLLARYKVLAACANRGYLYFLLAPVWVYMMHVSKMELAVRAYSPYGVVILGAVAATILLYMLMTYLRQVLPTFVVRLLERVGQSTLYILIVHTLFIGFFNELFAPVFTSGNIYHLTASIMAQAAVGTAIGVAISQLKRKKKAA